MQQLAEQTQASRARLEAELMEQERALRAEALSTRYFHIAGHYRFPEPDYFAISGLGPEALEAEAPIHRMRAGL